MVSRALSAGLGFIGLMFINSYLGPDVYGTIAWTLSLVTTFNCIADLGFNFAHVKRVSEGNDLSECVSTFLIIKLILTVTMVMFILTSMFVWTSILGYKLTDTNMDILILFIIYHVFLDIAYIATFTFDALLEAANTQLVLLMDPLLRVPMVIFISVNYLDTTILSFAYAMGGLAAAVLGLTLLAKKGLRMRRPSMFRSYLKFAMPIATITIMAALSVNIDKVIIGFFWASDTVGYYATSERVLELLLMVGLAVSTMTFPAFSKLFANGNLDKVRSLTQKAERYTAMVAFPMVVVLLIFPSQVLVIFFGDSYEPAGQIFQILSIGILLTLLNEIYFSQINAVNRPDLSARLFFISLSVNVVMLLVMVPTTLFGVEMLGLAGVGAAIARTVAIMAMFIATRYVIYKLTGTSFNPRILLIMLGALLTGIVIAILGSLWPMAHWFGLVVYGLLSIGIFAGFLWLLRELKREDVEYFLTVINPREMIRYVRSEMGRK
jgi:O-antigen/teichoic acid export membrane protein